MLIMKIIRNRRKYNILVMMILIIAQLSLFSCVKSEDDTRLQAADKEIVFEEKTNEDSEADEIKAEELKVDELGVKEAAENEKAEIYVPGVSKIEIQSEPNSTADINWNFLPDGEFVLTFNSYLNETTFTRYGTWVERSGYIIADFDKSEPISLNALFQKYGEDRKVIFNQIDEYSVKFPIYEENSDIWGVSSSLKWFEIEE